MTSTENTIIILVYTSLIRRFRKSLINKSILLISVSYRTQNYSWQLVPVLIPVFSGIIIYFTKRLFKEIKIPVWVTRTGGVFNIISIILTIAFFHYFPVYTLPEPSGSYTVAVTSIVMTDIMRIDKHFPHNNE